MKIIFLRLFSVSDEIIMPLHFGYLASSLPSGHQVRVLDQLRDRISERALLKSIAGEQPDILGLSAYSKDIVSIKWLMAEIRPALPKTKIILGGVQMSVMPEETFDYLKGGIDYGFSGEAEQGFPKFVEALERGGSDGDFLEVPSLVWRDKGEIRVNRRSFISNLDEIPFPRWELMPPESYPKAPHGAFYRQYPYAPIMTSRGCPYSCTFCAAGALSGKKLRYRSIDNVIEEIKYLKRNFGVREIHVEDDNFSMERKRAVDFSERLLRENLGITWAFPNGLRLDNLDLETLRLMKKAGCYAINVGVENGNEERLKEIKKGISKAEIRAGIARAKKAGLDIGGFFIIGFPGETLAEINNTIAFASELDLDRIGISYFQPYPGSEEYRRLSESGKYKFEFDRSGLSLHTVSYLPEGLTERQLKRLRFLGFVKFYFRLKIIIKLLKEIRGPEHLKFILKRGVRWLSS